MTEADVRVIAAALREHRDAILTRWVGAVGATSRGRITTAELESELGSLIDGVLNGLDSGSLTTQSESFGEARALLAELSRSRARLGFSPSETATSVFALKQAVLDKTELGGEGGAIAFVRFSQLLDELALFTFETYAEARDRIINQQAEEMLELSTPVVKLWDGIVAVPLVGTLDSARTQVVTEKLLQTLVDTGSEHAIIDITGVPAVDTQVAQHLLKTVVAARLMGAECTISGIRPQIAQTIVALGIEFGDVATKATLADALVMALRKIGVVLGAAGTTS
ncbi:MAG TPA: STAS domain-containing protein [Jatrophihabitans sp.]|jgi:rsbT co-antagonist protein RsbR|uniref:STAS domain-containing protein n=1 Tax=Jatrophihabitans sp. TaxID=1932789 RepID=UPI002E01C57B|nr:STAS domain-containing protein [Jatrophihabitans sp.]